MSLMELDRVGYSYGPSSQAVLDDVTFPVTRGENLGIVGESGAGKTTLLRLMLGLMSPSSGLVSWEGEPVRPADNRFMRRFRRKVQTVFQDPYSSLDPRQRVASIVSEPLRSLRVPGSHLEAVAEALESVGLGADVLSRYPHEFSGGQRQRIAIARAIVAKPAVVLADEPVSALDLSTRVRIVDLLKSLSERVTIVLVSHDLAIVAALCPKTIVLRKGRIVESGDTSRILRAPEHPYTQRLLESIPQLPA